VACQGVRAVRARFDRPSLRPTAEPVGAASRQAPDAARSAASAVSTEVVAVRTIERVRRPPSDATGAGEAIGGPGVRW